MTLKTKPLNTKNFYILPNNWGVNMSLLKKINESKTTKSALIGAAMLASSYMIDSGLNTAYAAGCEKDKVEVSQEVNKQYKTVDDILGDTFKAVSTDSYDEAVKSGENVVVLFYDTNGMNSPTEWLAHVFKEVAPEYKDKIEFYKFENDSDPSLNKNHYKGFREKFGIDAIPSYHLFKNGEKVYQQKGGPSESQIQKSIKSMKNNLEYLTNLD